MRGSVTWSFHQEAACDTNVSKMIGWTMRSSYVLAGVILCGALGTQAVWAQTQGQAVASPTSLKDAVERAVLQNPEVKLRYRNLEAAKHERTAAQGNWLPKIDLEVAGGPQQTLSPSLGSTKDYNSNRAQIQLRANLV